MPKIKKKHYRRANNNDIFFEQSNTNATPGSECMEESKNDCNDDNRKDLGSNNNETTLEAPHCSNSNINTLQVEDGYTTDGSSQGSSTSCNGNNSNFEVFACDDDNYSTVLREFVQPTISFRDSLASWAVLHKIPHNALNDLLKILKPMHNELPLDSRTLLETPLIYEVKPIDPGYYYHFGIENCIKSLILQCDAIEIINIDCLEVLINIDGLPIAKSSSSQFYPILCSLDIKKALVGMVGIYHGYGKPKDPNKFLQEFVTEATYLIEHGIIYNFKTYSFKIKYFICDVPAKSYILCIKGHSGYYSCTKCYTEGSYVNGRVCFPDQNFTLRTDDDFRQKKQPEHHSGTTILEQLPQFNIIDNFILDPMHLIYLGVVKKLIHLWCTGKPPSRLSASSIDSISKHLVYLKNQVPLEFNRKPRSLSEYKRWKATEFRHFLLYFGPVILKKNPNYDIYLNFLSLHVGITILSNGKLNVDFRFEADAALKYFFKTFLILYGKENASHNIHNLLHLANRPDFKPLDEYSAFNFENYMSSILKMLRKHDKPLQQIIRRKGEIDVYLKNSAPKYQSYPELVKNKDSNQYEKAIFQNFTLKTLSPDNCCGLKDGSIVLAQKFVIENNKKILIGKKINKTADFYTQPCNSSDLGVFLVNIQDLGCTKKWDIESVAFKYVKLNLENQPSVVFPLVHTY